MAQDKEKIKELNRKIKELESIIEQKNTSLQDYQEIEKIADDKIKGLNAIHAEKIRSLMNSIQTLKKENASINKNSKEHKRSEFIQQLNKEVADQDAVIEVLRGLINDQKKADNAIIQMLTKGPPRIRVATREELKIEIKDLKTKLLKYEKKKGQGTAEEEKMNKMEEDQQSIISTKLAEVKTNTGNAEYIMKINELNNEIEDLKLSVSGKQAEVDKYKQLMTKKNQEIIELTQSKVDLKFMMTKNEELKNELEALRQKLNSDLYTNYDQTIKLEELELATTVHKNLQNKSNEAIRMEIETIQNKLLEVAGQNKQLIMTNTKLKDDNATMKKLLDDAKERNRKMHSEHEEQISKMNAAVKEKEAAFKTMSTKLAQFEGKFDQLNVEIKNKEAIIAELEAKVIELDEQLANRPERVSSRKDLDASVASVLTESRKLELEKESNYLKQEIFRLRERVKELTRSEIELSDKVDMLEQENRFLSKKVIAANLINRETYSGAIRVEEMQAYLKENALRYETRIKDLTAQIKELEVRNRELEDIQMIMNNPSGSLKSLNSMAGSIALTENDNDTLADKI